MSGLQGVFRGSWSQRDRDSGGFRGSPTAPRACLAPCWGPGVLVAGVEIRAATWCSWTSGQAGNREVGQQHRGLYVCKACHGTLGRMAWPSSASPSCLRKHLCQGLLGWGELGDGRPLPGGVKMGAFAAASSALWMAAASSSAAGPAPASCRSAGSLLACTVVLAQLKCAGVHSILVQLKCAGLHSSSGSALVCMPAQFFRSAQLYRPAQLFRSARVCRARRNLDGTGPSVCSLGCSFHTSCWPSSFCLSISFR